MVCQNIIIGSIDEVDISLISKYLKISEIKLTLNAYKIYYYFVVNGLKKMIPSKDLKVVIALQNTIIYTIN